MFEERCLACGLHLADDGRAYCSEQCENNDLYSPSISSASSVLSSPQLGYAAGGEVPSLMPSALGSALTSFTGKNAHYVSYSSASSTSWPGLTDDEDHSYSSEYGYHDAPEPIFDPNAKAANFVNPSALSYTRRPSGTNNHSTVPQVKRPSSPSPFPHVRAFPRSLPIHSHVPVDDDELYSDVGYSSGDALDAEDNESSLPSEREDHPPPAKSKRSRNRASLPACFSLLQMGSPSKSLRSSPISSSSGNTIARPSPPTPKLTHKSAASNIRPVASIPLSSMHATPRGRRREPGQSSSSRWSGHSSGSRSRSKSRRVQAPGSPHILDEAFSSRGSVTQQVFEWTSDPALLPRGRPALRRNSSPLPKLAFGVEDAMLSDIRQAAEADTGSGSRLRTRGRARVEDLEGFGTSINAPGYGNGRSGLLSRQRAHPARVPL